MSSHAKELIAEHENRQIPAGWTGKDFAWIFATSSLACLGSIFMWAANAPGRMSNDSSYQLRQVLGEVPLNDWHPVIMTLTWRSLYEATGHIGSMVLVQIILAFLASALLSIYLHDLTRQWKISLLGVGIVSLPHVLTFVGVMWKDTQMMIALFLAVVLILLADRFRKIRVPLLALSLFFMIYGVMVRKNAIFAILPLVVLLFVVWRNQSRFSIWLTHSKKRQLVAAVAAIACFALLTAATSTVLTAVTKPSKAGQLSQVFLDDVIFTMSSSEIEKSNAPEALKAKLVAARTLCTEKHAIWNAYWQCYGRGATGQPFEAIANQEELKDLWLNGVATNPTGYVAYHAQTFARFLFTTSLVYQKAPSVASVPHEYQVKTGKADSILTDYVVNFGYKMFPWFFHGWFWLFSSILLFMFGRRATYVRTSVLALTSSGFLYLVGYFPIVPASNYRYSYWASLSDGVCK